VPVADQNLIPVPLTRNTTNSTLEQDYLLVGDVWPTAWQAVTWSNFESGDSVAVWGAGPVGLLAAYSAKLRGASRIYVIDHVPMRLERAESMGAIAINFVEEDVVETLRGYEPDGVMRLIEAVGAEALDSNLNYDSSIIWNQMISVAHHDAGIGIVGLYFHAPAGELNPNGDEIAANISFPYTQFFASGVTVRGGLVDPLKDAGRLVELIRSGVAHPAELITTADVGIEQIPEYFARFERWEEIKVYMTFPH
jgi:threonine dehydrogenase-like Zn-dependent dehydrogenase